MLPLEKIPKNEMQGSLSQRGGGGLIPLSPSEVILVDGDPLYIQFLPA